MNKEICYMFMYISGKVIDQEFQYLVNGDLKDLVSL
jgi:hypothetical protein